VASDVVFCIAFNADRIVVMTAGREGMIRIDPIKPRLLSRFQQSP
jgi:hypothetical protein